MWVRDTRVSGALRSPGTAWMLAVADRTRFRIRPTLPPFRSEYRATIRGAIDRCEWLCCDTGRAHEVWRWSDALDGGWKMVGHSMAVPVKFKIGGAP